MKLVRPSSEYADSFAEALAEFEKADIGGFWLAGGILKDRGVDAYISATAEHEKGVNLPEGWVPNSTFWLIDDYTFIGHGNIRHCLNDWLEKRGGHIGYSVRPSMHRKGYGTAMLQLLCDEATRLGIKDVLVTCSAHNPASKKIIERNGGKLIDQIKVEDEQVLRYEINIDSF